MNLPTEYAAAEKLANAMLAAARQDDWDAVVTLRSQIPALARSLDRRWSAIGRPDPEQARQLEKQRINAIRRVLAVDDQIRRLSDACNAPLDRWLRRGATTSALN